MSRNIFFTALICLLCISHTAFSDSSKQPNDPSLPYTWDNTYYFRTTGAPTRNGAEAWMTMTGKQDTVYAAKATPKQLAQLKFHVEDALAFNRLLPEKQRLKIGDKLTMVEFTKHHVQSLVGYLPDQVFVSVIRLPDNRCLTKFEGRIQAVARLGFDVTGFQHSGHSGRIQILQHLQTRDWGVLSPDNTGKIRILVPQKARNGFAPVELAHFIARPL